MPKASFKSKDSAEKLITQTLPWTSTHFGDQSEIEALNKSTGKWETIADVHTITGVDAEDIADLIIRATNEYAERKTKI